MVSELSYYYGECQTIAYSFARVDCSLIGKHSLFAWMLITLTVCDATCGYSTSRAN